MQLFVLLLKLRNQFVLSGLAHAPLHDLLNVLLDLGVQLVNYLLLGVLFAFEFGQLGFLLTKHLYLVVFRLGDLTVLLDVEVQRLDLLHGITQALVHAFDLCLKLDLHLSNFVLTRATRSLCLS